MYVPPAFKIDELPAIHAAMRRARVAQFITATEQGPMASLLPLFLDETEGPNGTLHGHMARANPHWQAPPLGEAMALFMGPEAYVSPSFYETKRETGKVVPTWNYVMVEALGPVEYFENTERLLEVVTRLTSLHEGPRSQPWAVSDAPAGYVQSQLKGIVGIRMPIMKLSGKAKLSQNRPAADRQGVIAGLSGSDEAGEQAISAIMSQQRG